MELQTKFSGHECSDYTKCHKEYSRSDFTEEDWKVTRDIAQKVRDVRAKYEETWLKNGASYVSHGSSYKCLYIMCIFIEVRDNGILTNTNLPKDGDIIDGVLIVVKKHPVAPIYADRSQK